VCFIGIIFIHHNRQLAVQQAGSYFDTAAYIFQPPNSYFVDHQSSKSKTTQKSSSKQLNYNVNLFEELKRTSESGIDLLPILNEHKQQISESNIFKIMKAYKGPALDRFNDYPNAKPHYNSPYIGVKQDNNYCDIVDTYNLLNPQNVFDTKNFVGDYIPKSLVKKFVFPAIGQDVMPDAHMGVTVRRWKMNETATAFFTKSVLMHHYFKIGTQFMCASQIYNHIPGNGILTRKDMNVGMVNDYAKKYENKPQCFNKHMYFPYAYRLNNQTECTQFFAEINSPEYHQLKKTEPVPFIIKIGWGAHRGDGVFLFDDAKETSIRETYQNGEICGENKKDLLAQKYIPNPLLLDLNNKFDFRMYMLVASVNPVIAFYHDGFLRVSLGIYDKDSKEKGVHFTNTHLSKKTFKDAGSGRMIHNMTEEELRDYQMWTMEDLQDYLLQSGKIKNDRWLDEYLRPKFKEAFIHTIRMSQHSYMTLSGAFEMFGLDFLLDEDLNLWFIECNASPQLIGTNEYKTNFLTKMLTDMFEIQYAYLRSRWRRIQTFVAKFQTQASEQGTSSMDIKVWKSEFDNINRNRLEPEFTISQDNTWHKIIDKNLPGKDAYLGFIPEECIDDEDL